MRMPRCQTLVLLAFVSLFGISWADEAGLRRCRGVTDSAARLACYDALPLPVPGARSAEAPRAAAPAQVAPKVAPRTTPAERFGLEHQAAALEQADMIESRIAGRFEGWGPKSLIRLANGQVWQVVDDTSRMIPRDNPKVTIRRGILGAFYLDIEGDNRSPRVRRVQ